MITQVSTSDSPDLAEFRGGRQAHWATESPDRIWRSSRAAKKSGEYRHVKEVRIAEWPVED